MQFGPLVAIGGLTLILFFVLLVRRKLELDATLLGLFTIGILPLLVAAYNPSTIKYGDFQLIKKVEKIEERVRPFAVIDIPGKSIIFDSFEPGDFQFLGTREGGRYFSFLLKREPKFLEARSTNAGAIAVKLSHTSEGIKYEGRFDIWESENNEVQDRVIVEAYF